MTSKTPKPCLFHSVAKMTDTQTKNRNIFFQKIEHSGGVLILYLTSLFSFVTFVFHLKSSGIFATSFEINDSQL